MAGAAAGAGGDSKSAAATARETNDVAVVLSMLLALQERMIAIIAMRLMCHDDGLDFTRESRGKLGDIVQSKSHKWFSPRSSPAFTSRLSSNQTSLCL